MYQVIIKNSIRFLLVIGLLLPLSPTKTLAIDCEEFLEGTRPGETRRCEERVNAGAVVGIVLGLLGIIGLGVYIASAAGDNSADKDDSRNEDKNSNSFTFSLGNFNSGNFNSGNFNSGVSNSGDFKRSNVLSLSPHFHLTEEEQITGLRLKYSF